MVWYTELGLKKNPLLLNPLEDSFHIEGRSDELQELLYRIESGSMLLIEGKQGCGKTTLLKAAIEEYRGRGRVAYIDAQQVEDLNITEIISDRPQNMILLLDNVNFLSKKNNERIRYYYDEDMIQAVVFTTSNKDQIQFSQALQTRLSNNIVQLEDLSLKDSVTIVYDLLRVVDLQITHSQVKYICTQLQTIKHILMCCDVLCEQLVENEKEKADSADVEKAIQTVTASLGETQ